MLDIFSVGELNCFGEGAKVFHDVFGVLDEQSSISNESIAASGGWCTGLSWYGKDIASLFAGVASSDQRT